MPYSSRSMRSSPCRPGRLISPSVRGSARWEYQASAAANNSSSVNSNQPTRLNHFMDLPSSAA